MFRRFFLYDGAEFDNRWWKIRMVIFQKIQKFIQAINYIFFIDYYHRFFRKNIKVISRKSRKIILFNATEDLKSLFFGYTLALEKKYSDCEFIFYLPLLSYNTISYKKNFILFVIFFYYKNLILFFRNLKWKNLYLKFGLVFLEFNNWNIFKEIILLKKSEKILADISSPEDLKKLRYKSILVGDLIYDTYLRYNNIQTHDSRLFENYKNYKFFDIIQKPSFTAD